MFYVGQRVIFEDREAPIATWFHATSTGIKGLVMHLNHKDEAGRVKPITGRVLKIDVDPHGNVDLVFQPDGWPAGLDTQGFHGDSKYFKAYPEESLAWPGVLTNQVGMALSSEAVAEAVRLYLEAKQGNGTRDGLSVEV